MKASLRTAAAFVAWVAFVALAVSATRTPPPSNSADHVDPQERRPSIVEVRNGGSRFTYLVDGDPTRIRCFGYNTVTRTLSQEERSSLYARDFAQMRGAGANTLQGWDQANFDEVLLDAADKESLGVILHFELAPHWPYQNQTFRKLQLVNIEQWVTRYRDYPALRMWGLGNETLWGIEREETAQEKAFASFLIQAADLVHRLDPYHPVIYREAEDAYLDRLIEAFSADGRPRPWFVYGANFFTPRLREALQRQTLAEWRQPVLLSEFGQAFEAPMGLHGTNRPWGYVEAWATIGQFSDRVLGGCVYVWNTAGPPDQPLDYTFGMVDPTGRPADETLDVMGKIFREDERQETLRATARRR